ncbi:FeoB small GTPase domain-containing protein [Enterococcus rivorum]|uniref:FeoB small GTPase domain-containing protein n=1 Tax=Enterococcus rivorum TaxID=762845 RepID=UPI003638BDFB
MTKEFESQEKEEVTLENTGTGEAVIAFAGNPNVGKSSLFNELTGMRQHTGNWPGKTVSFAQGTHLFNGVNYRLVDLPGTYSLLAHSTEEEVARDFIIEANPKATVVVCDATALERNLNLVLQIITINPHVIVCVNLLDEAKRKHIDVNLEITNTFRCSSRWDFCCQKRRTDFTYGTGCLSC